MKNIILVGSIIGWIGGSFATANDPGDSSAIYPAKKWKHSKCTVKNGNCNCPFGLMQLDVMDSESTRWRVCVKNVCPEGSNLMQREDQKREVYFTCFRSSR